MADVLLRASASPRWARCPASAGLEAQFPNPDTDDAMEGTAAHELLERRLKGLCVSAYDLVGQKAENGVTFSEEMAEHVEATNHTLNIWRDAGVELYVEQEVITPQNNVSGHLDIGGWSPNTKTIRIGDFKYGMKKVEPEHNEQMIHYGLGLEHSLGVKAEWFEFAIFQPRDYSTGGVVKTWAPRRADIQDDIDRIVAAAEEARGPRPTAKWGEHCRDCKAAHACPALRTAVMMGGQVVVNGRYETLDAHDTAEEIRMYRQIERLMKTRLEAIENHGNALIADGHVLPGFVQQPTYHRKTWVDESNLKTLGGLYGVDLYNKRPMTPNQAEKALGVPSGTIDNYTKRIQSGVKLVEKDLSNEAEKVFGK